MNRNNIAQKLQSPMNMCKACEFVAHEGVTVKAIVAIEVICTAASGLKYCVSTCSTHCQTYKYQSSASLAL